MARRETVSLCWWNPYVKSRTHKTKFKEWATNTSQQHTRHTKIVEDNIKVTDECLVDEKASMMLDALHAKDDDDSASIIIIATVASG